jgi:non-haem Fe2+, alpha-ketoglutarate-dependent halogenase
MTQTTAFTVIPDQQDINRMERDLRFHACTTPDPKTLTHEQLEHFNQAGYLKGLRLFDAQEAEANRIYFDALLERVLAAGGDSYSISTAHLKYGKVYDLLTHPRLVAIVKDLLGENVIAWGSHFFCKMPRDGKAVAWHQDASYWPLSPSKAVTVWLAIDAADRTNACMRFLGGSHHFGHLTFRPSDPSEHNVLNQSIDDVERFGTPVDVELQAGEISLHSDLLLHGSDTNTSNRRRCGLTLRYCSADVRAELGWNAKGVIVSGSDPSGHWANSARPEND